MSILIPISCYSGTVIPLSVLISPNLSVHHSLLLQVHPTSECAADEGRKSQGNHGYHTRAAMEETSRQSAEAADDDESTSEVHIITLPPCFAA